MPYINEFEKLIYEKTGQCFPITYHPRKPLTYLKQHPISNQLGELKGFSFIDQSERRQLAQTNTIFPASELGCYQVSLMSDGNIYSCCEGIHPLGSITDPVPDLINTMKLQLETWSDTHPHNACLGCTEPDFVCGLKSQYNQNLEPRT